MVIFGFSIFKVIKALLNLFFKLNDLVSCFLFVCRPFSFFACVSTLAGFLWDYFSNLTLLCPPLTAAPADSCFKFLSSGLGFDLHIVIYELEIKKVQLIRTSNLRDPITRKNSKGFGRIGLDQKISSDLRVSDVCQSDCIIKVN